MKNNVRQPQQERSIEKKNKIIQAGYKLFAEVGYHGTNTAEIAKEAGVSTGAVYDYFCDKRDIMISVLHLYVENASRPVMQILTEAKPLDIPKVAAEILDKTVSIHRENARLHNTLHALAAADEAVNAAFIALEDHVTKKVAEALAANGIQRQHAEERVHLAMNMIQSFAHEYVFDKHEYIDYAAMRDIVCKQIVSLFE